MKNLKYRKYLKYFDSFRGIFTEDKISIYAAQASFFVIISAVPFISLLISVISFFIPADTAAFLGAFALPGHVTYILGSLLDSLKNAPAVSLLSVSALTTLWSAAKGFGALRHGIEKVYAAGSGKGYFRRKLQALINTLVFIVFIIAVIAVLLFGEYILKLPFMPELKLLSKLRIPLFAVLLAVFFELMYLLIARDSEIMPRRITAHLPGAIFAALGWLIFSEGYGLYIRYFPGASYIYGGLAAVCLMMLWLYFCISILLFGAELNKLIYIIKNKT